MAVWPFSRVKYPIYVMYVECIEKKNARKLLRWSLNWYLYMCVIPPLVWDRPYPKRCAHCTVFAVSSSSFSSSSTSVDSVAIVLYTLNGGGAASYHIICINVCIVSTYTVLEKKKLSNKSIALPIRLQSISSWANYLPRWRRRIKKREK